MNFANLLVRLRLRLRDHRHGSVTPGTIRTALKRQRVGICAQSECWFERGAVK
jgi:hypothetical protein